MDNYQRVYYVGLLDDLHNYFPALLYNSQQFQTVPDVLNYVRDTTIRRFNLYDNANQQYHTRFPNVPPVVPTNAFMRPQEPLRTAPSNRRTTDMSLLFPLLRSLGTSPVATVPTANLYNDIVVSASQQLIDSTSTEESLLEDLEGNCTICQDRMRQGEVIRKLNVCTHKFHKLCIDNWFLNSSVHCPVCRHDIREPAIITPRSPSLRSSNLRQRSQDSSEMNPEELVTLLFGRNIF